MTRSTERTGHRQSQNDRPGDSEVLYRTAQ